MEYNPYEILGLAKSATREEIETRYRELSERFKRDRFLVGEAGEEAAENLERLEIAYRDIMAEATSFSSTSSDNTYEQIQELIKSEKYDEAQDKLDDCDIRDAEWHYLQSVIFYKRSWFLESKKQLEFAVQMEPDNQRYKDSLQKLTKILASNTISPDQLRTNERPAGQAPNRPNNGTCSGSVCVDCMLCNMCCNCSQLCCRC